MAAHPGLHTLAAAALTTAVLLARWWATRAVRDAHGASAARAPWRRAVHPPAGESVSDRVAELHASFLDPALKETDAHLEQYWNKLTALYPHRDGERRHR